MQIKFKQWLCNLAINRYQADDSIAIRLVLAETDPAVVSGDCFPGEQIATATVCLSGNWLLSHGEVLIKGYSENEGMVEAFVAAGVLQSPHMHLDLRGGMAGPRRLFSGDAQQLRSMIEQAGAYVAVCRFTPQAIEQLPQVKQWLDEQVVEEEDEGA